MSLLRIATGIWEYIVVVAVEEPDSLSIGCCNGLLVATVSHVDCFDIHLALLIGFFGSKRECRRHDDLCFAGKSLFMISWAKSLRK